MKSRTLLRQYSVSAVAAIGISLVASLAYATDLCHNIGGPADLGANCDGTGTCTYVLQETTITVPKDHFLGILLGAPQFQFPVDLTNPSVIAHLAHGDGLSIMNFDPPLHLASTIGPHRASNVECFAKRLLTTQPPEPGN